MRRGKPAPLTIDEEAFDGIKAWLDKMTDPDYGRVGYIQRGGSPARPQELIDRFPGDKSEAMTAVGVLRRIFLGEDPRRSELIKKGADLMVKLPPDVEPERRQHRHVLLVLRHARAVPGRRPDVEDVEPGDPGPRSSPTSARTRPTACTRARGTRSAPGAPTAAACTRRR